MQRGNSILRLGRSDRHAGDAGTPTGAATSPESATDSRLVFPCTIHHNGRLGGLNTVFAESAQARNEWKQKLEEAIGLRKVVQDSNKVFEIETLSADTFLVPSMMSGSNTAWSHENAFTGKVTCSVPFSKLDPLFLISLQLSADRVIATSDGRGLVAIGCAEGVWIGFRHDSKCEFQLLCE